MLLTESLLGSSSTAANYIEDVFSTYLYAGNGSTRTITNGIDLSTYGGLIWIKSRNNAATHHQCDTVRGVKSPLHSETTQGEGFETQQVTGVTTSGFTLGTDGASNSPNYNGNTFASWTFRKQAKFFDVVTWTGNGGTSGRTITHNLGSAPGCIIVKNITSAEDWYVYPASLGNTGTKQYFLILNSTAAQDTGGFGIEKSSNWTSTQFSLVAGTSALNGSGQTYVAYLFAHDAGGFGASGADNVISCGSFTTDGSGNATVSLGYEPQWLLVKNATTASNNEWRMVDNMRGFPVNAASSSVLTANSSAAEFTSGTINLLNTGFQIDGLANSATFIYIAIRRGPMKTPTSGTSVFYPGTTTNDTNTMTTGFPVDMMIEGLQNATFGKLAFDRLRGSGYYLYTNATDAEAYSGNSAQFQNSTGINGGAVIGAGYNYIFWNFRRAPGFFDVVCYTGTGSSPQTINHNLGVAPELIISRRRSPAGNWFVGANFTATDFTPLYLNDPGGGSTTAYGASSAWVSKPANNSYTVANSLGTSGNPYNFVAYLFATVAGVSKVGSYTGSGTTKQIDCGFTNGARFVLIKRTDASGDWYVWDSARGIVSGNDPYLLLNSTAAEVTSTDYIDTYSAGFEISSTAPAAINASGGTFIFLAIA